MEEHIKTKLTNDIKIEISELIKNKWMFLNMNWPIITPKYNHRSEIKSVKILILSRMFFLII